MCRIGEVRAVAYGHQDRGSDPHTHPGDGCQDFIKREGIDHLVDLGGDQVALFFEHFDVGGEQRDRAFDGAGSGHYDGLLV